MAQAASTRSRLVAAGRGEDREVAVAHARGIEAPRVGGQARERGGQAHAWRLRATHRRTGRVDARDHVVAQVGRAEPALLQLRDDLAYARVDLEQARGPGVALAQARGERAGAEGVDAAQQRVVGAAGEALVAL